MPSFAEVLSGPFVFFCESSVVSESGICVIFCGRYCMLIYQLFARHL